jgi:hypothetical protein
LRLFTASQRRQVARAAARAEELIRGFYCIPGRERSRFPYDVATLADDPGPGRRVFADLVRVVRPASAEAGRDPREIYRIRLRDDELLAATAPPGEVLLAPLLLYVLTHELVHVVRFASGLAIFDDDDPGRREEEENRVHSITRRVLDPVRDGALRTVVDRHFAERPPDAELPD